MAGSAIGILFTRGNAILAGGYFQLDFLWIIAFLAVFGTTIPTALFANSIPRVGAGVSSILMTVELPVAVLVANLILNESMGIVQLGGIVWTLTSIAAMNYFKSVKNSKRSQQMA